MNKYFQTHRDLSARRSGSQTTQTTQAMSIALFVAIAILLVIAGMQIARLQAHDYTMTQAQVNALHTCKYNR